MADVEHIDKTLDTKSEKLKKLSDKPRKEYFCEKCNKTTHPTEDHGKLGGVRAGAGMPAGTITVKKLESHKIKKKFDEGVMRAATKLLNAQLGLALGEQSLYVKYYTGEGKDRKKHVDIVNDPEIIKEYIVDDGLTLNGDSDEEYYFLSTKPANNQAIDSLLNRVWGKAPEKLQIEGGFFNKSELTVKVVGSRHDLIDIGEDGRIVESSGESDTPTK